ncbi:MAG: IPT/TIG domain-containing protein, partial [Patescibacteria group bacterium]
SLSPTSGTTAGGTTVTITGTDFTGATVVNFGSTPATGVVVSSSTSITATSPAEAAGTVDVTVTTPSGTSATSSADQYTYVVPPPAPTVSAVSPTSGTTAGGTLVTITGTDFTGATAVMFGTTSATGVIIASSTSLTAISPAHAAGTVDVTVTTPSGTSATSSADQYTYVVPVLLAPVISGISVTAISSTTATINWNTDVPASSQVAYGTTTSYGSMSAYNGTASTTHMVVLTGLLEGTLYHFAVKSGNIIATTTSSDNTFVTQSTSSSTPLALTGTDSVDTAGVADGTFANGWKYVLHFTVPDNEDAFRIQFTNWSGSAGTFATANNIRVSTPQSSNASTTSTGMMVTAANTYTDWIYLTGDSSALTPGRQIDVTVEVRIPLGTTPGTYSTSFVANTTPSTATSTTP